MEITEDSVSMEWSPPDSLGGIDMLGYIIERRETGTTNWIKVGHTDPATTKFRALNLLEGREYVFRVSAENLEGESAPISMISPVMPMREICK